MAYELNFNSEYVYLKYTGVIDFSERKQAKDDVINLCFEKGLHRSLVDLRLSDIKMSKADVINFAASFEKINLPIDYRLAVIIGIDNQTENIIEVMIGVDGISVKYFFEFEEAESWLTAI